MEIRKHNLSRRQSYRPYDTDDITRAYMAVKDNSMSIRKAAASFSIPKSTLMDRVHGRVSVDVVKSGTPPMFSEEHEAYLAKHLTTMAEVGYGYSRQETINLASEYSIFLGLRDKEHPLTDKWLYKFLDRWPDLKVKKPRSLDVARAKSATRVAVDSYFDELSQILEKNNLKEKPHMIFNIDEKCLSTDHKPPKVIAGKHSKTQAITSGRSKNVTLIGCVSAVGQQVPPFFVFPGVRMFDSLMEGATPGAEGTVSPSGWSNSQIFIEYMQNHLLKYLPARNEISPVLVLYDGHTSHVSLGLIEWAKSENIILFVLPPHCSHILQPLDVSCFGPFEVAWNAACHHHMRETGGSVITRYDVCRMACKVYTTTLSVPNAVSAFKRCGIHPFNADAISDSQVAPASTFKRHENPLTTATVISSSQSVPTVAEPSASMPADVFLHAKGGQILANVETAKKPRNTLSRVVGGKAITENDIIDKIREHNDKRDSKKIKPKTQKNRINSKRANAQSPTPGTSGIALKRAKKIAESVESSDDDIPETDTCVVCKRFNPDSNKNPYKLIVNWCECDKCHSWVHLSFCSPVKVIRRGDKFLCPKCTDTPTLIQK